VSGRQQKVEIRAHAAPDPDPNSTKWLEKTDLTYARARVVLEFMVQHGVAEKRLRITAAADTEPLSDTGDTEVTDAGLETLKGLTNLRELHLWSTDVTDSGLVHLERLTKLQSLSLDGCQRVTDAGLEHLKGLVNLKKLVIASRTVSGTGLVHLAELSNLERLNLNHTQTSDAGLLHLKGLTSLEGLGLNSTQVTDLGMCRQRPENVALAGEWWLTVDFDVFCSVRLKNGAPR